MIVKSQAKGTLILRVGGRFFKVLAVRSRGDNWYTFECKHLESMKSCTFKYQLLGMLDAMNHATSLMKRPEDIMMIDMDNHGEWKLVTKEQIDKVIKSERK